MDIKEYLEKKLQIQNEILEISSDKQTVEDLNLDKINQYYYDLNINENENEFRSFFNLLNNISSNIHRSPDFLNKIDKILLLIKNDFKKYYEDSELFLILNKSLNKRILFFLIENQILKINYYISDYMINDFEYTYLIYFFKELKPFLDAEKIQAIEKEYDVYSENFNQNRKNGENEQEICKMIRNDSIKDFVSYISMTNFPLKSIIKKSIYETNPLLIKNDVSLIEYAAFFGAINIFNYLRMNNVELTPSLWIYAIHGNNPEIIHLLEEYHVEPEDKTYEKCIEEAIKCFDEDIANYLIQQKDIPLNIIYSFGLANYNYNYFPSNFDCNEIFFNLCKNGHFFLVEKMLQTNQIVDINFKMKDQIVDYDGFCSPLIVSISNNHANIVDLLLKCGGIDINDEFIEYKKGFYQLVGNGLYNAVLHDNSKIVKLLLNDKNIDVNKKSYQKFFLADSFIHMNENIPLFMAIENKNIEIIKLLLSHPKIDINMYSLIYDANKNPNENENSKLFHRQTALYLTIKSECLEIVKLLLNHPNVDVNIMSFNTNSDDKYEETPLYCSIRENKDEITKLFLMHPKINVNIKSHIFIKEYEINEPALNLAIKNENTPIVKLLLDSQNIDVNIKSIKVINTHKSIESPLSLAIKKGNKEVVMKLLKFQNINVNFKSHSIFNNVETSETSLHIAGKNENIEIVKLLLQFPLIDVNKKSIKFEQKDGFCADDNKTKNTALQISILNGNYEMTSILLSHQNIDVNEQGVNISNSNVREWNALIMAIEQNNIKIVKLLLSHPKIEVNTIYSNKNINFKRVDRSPLFLAIEKRYDKIAELLIERNDIDVNFISLYKNETSSKIKRITTLHEAFVKRNGKIIQILLNKENINVNMKSIIYKSDFENSFFKEEKTTLEYAIGYGNINIIRSLLAKENLDFNHKSESSYFLNGELEKKCKSPLEISIEKKDPEIFQILINYYSEKYDLTTENLNHLYNMNEDEKIKSIISNLLHKH